MSHLNYLESLGDIDPLLLVGIAEDREIEALLKKTHPKFMSDVSLDPQHWMPGQRGRRCV